MTRNRRLNVTLDEQLATKLARTAVRARMTQQASRASGSRGLDEAGADPRVVVALLDGTPKSLEHAQCGLRQARSGKTIDLDDL